MKQFDIQNNAREYGGELESKGIDAVNGACDYLMYLRAATQVVHLVVVGVAAAIEQKEDEFVLITLPAGLLSHCPAQDVPAMVHRDRMRDPCPWVILNDAGAGFAMGSIGGGLWHFVKGARNAPRGERLSGALQSMKARGPVMGGGFAVWASMFATFDCAFAGIRQKEDGWNSILSGFTTGGVLAARAGWKASLTSAMVGGVLLGMMEGVGVLMSSMEAENYRPQAPILPPELQDQAVLQK